MDADRQPRPGEETAAVPGTGGSPAGGNAPVKPDPWGAATQPSADPWAAFGTVAGGIFVWGGAGWLLTRWLGSPLFTLAGLLLGLGAAFYLVWVRYGKA